MKLPTPAELGQPVGSVQTEAANTPFINVRPADQSAGARDLQQAGTALQQAGGLLVERRRDHNLREAEREIFDWNKTQLDPRTGMASQRGAQAAGMADHATASFSELRTRILDKYGDGIGNSGKEALTQLLDGAEQRAWSTAVGHETRELEADAQRQHVAAVDSLEDIAAAQLYYGDTEAAASTMLNLTSRIEDEGIRNGYTGDALEQYVENGVSKAWSTAITGMFNSGQEIEAEAVLQELMDTGKIDQTDAIALMNQVAPAAEDKRNRIAAGEAFQQANAPVGSTPGKQPTVDNVMASLIFQESGFGAQFGGSRSLEDATTVQSSAGATGLTQIMPATMKAPGMGVTPYRYADGVPEGTPVQVVAREQERFGREYLQALVNRYDGNMQFALYAYNWGAGNVDSWLKTGVGVDGQAMPKETADYAPAVLSRVGYTARAGKPGEGAVVIDDGMTSRDRLLAEKGQGAVEHFDRMVAADHTRSQQLKTQIYGAAVSEVDALFAQQPTVDLDAIMDANPGLRQQLGDKITTLRAYVDKRNKGEEIGTDPASYGALVTLRETDPDAFARTDLLGYVDRLDRSTLKGLQEDQAEILGAPAETSNRVSRSTVNDAVGDYISAMTTGDNRTQKMDKVKMEVRDWANGVLDQTGTPPTDLAMRIFTEKVLATPGEKSSTTFAMDQDTGVLDRAPFGAADDFMEAASNIDEAGFDAFLSDDTPTTLTLPAAAGTVEVTITQQERQQLYRELQLELRRAPTGADFMTGVLLKYSDVFNP